MVFRLSNLGISALVQPDLAARLEANVTVKNVGQTPAYNLKWAVGMTFFQGMDIPIESALATTEPEPKDEAGTMASGQTHSFGSVYFVTQEDLREIQHVGGLVLIQIVLTYTDVFQRVIKSTMARSIFVGRLFNGDIPLGQETRLRFGVIGGMPLNGDDITEPQGPAA